MIIDIANRNVRKIEYYCGGEICSRLYLYSPDKGFCDNLRRCYEKNGMDKDAERLIADDETELTYIHLDYRENKVVAFRSITSHYELFYTVLKNGKKVFTDHMRNLLSYIPVKEREVAVEAVCDVALFQHNYGKETYIKGVYRLGLGELLTADSEGIRTRQEQMLEIGKYDLSGERGEKVIYDSLCLACDKMVEKGAVNTLSGGVDSTLTHIIMGNPKSVSGCYNHEAFQKEKRCALDAVAMLSADHTIYDIEMSEYMDKMKGVSKAYGLPPFNLSTQVMHYTIAEHIKNSKIVVSEMAGGAFGIESRTPCTLEAANQYPMNHVYNWANLNNHVVGAEERRYLEKMFGKEMVDKRLSVRNDYVLARIKNLDITDNSVDNYIQFGAFIRYFSYSVVGIEEQTETEAGNSIVCLMHARRLMENIASLDKKGRYRDEVWGEKPYAKILLKQLLPEYEVNRPKLGGALPRTWMVTEGPMAGYFKEHDIPDFVPENLHEDMKHPAWDCSWGVKHMVMFSLWKEAVLDREVEKIPSKFWEEVKN